MPILQMVSYLVEDKWKPWANTIAYYPLTSNTTIYEQSWKNKDLTNTWATFWLYQWVDCAYLSGNVYMYNSTQYWLSWDVQFTASIWAYFIDKWEWAANPRFYWNDNWNIWFNPWGNTTNYELQQSVWSNLIVMYDWTKSYLYINWTQIAEYTASTNFSNWPLWIWKYAVSWTNYWKWGLSEFILENKAWTAQEVADYYNQTKWNYWL